MSASLFLSLSLFQIDGVPMFFCEEKAVYTFEWEQHSWQADIHRRLNVTVRERERKMQPVYFDESLLLGAREEKEIYTIQPFASLVRLTNILKYRCQGEGHDLFLMMWKNLSLALLLTFTRMADEGDPSHSFTNASPLMNQHRLPRSIEELFANVWERSLWAEHWQRAAIHWNEDIIHQRRIQQSFIEPFGRSS
jgi:hypothetical protein